MVLNDCDSDSDHGQINYIDYWHQSKMSSPKKIEL